MLQAVIAGLLAGYAIAVPVGAIAVLIIQTGLSHGLRSGIAAAAGAASADLIYASTAALAGLWVASLIGPLIGPLRVVGGVILIALGVRGLLALSSARESINPMAAHDEARRPHHRTYLTLLALTLLNPATIVYFTALTVGLPFLGGPGERLAFAAAAGFASLSWQLLLAIVGAALGRGGGHRVRYWSAVLGNGVIVVLGALIALSAFTASG
jgi:threonine/homoserine/homoserine lactone efflux protein